MLRFLFLLLLVAAAWFGWRHYGEVFQKRPGHEAVIENLTGREMRNVRLTVGGETFVKETIADNGLATFPFHVGEDASFQLVWLSPESTVERTWSGGMVPKGPMQQRHFLTVDSDANVLYRAENK
jgi:hypothetical protein